MKQAPGYEAIDVLVPNGSSRAVKLNQAVLLALEVPKTNTAGEVTVVAAESTIGGTKPSSAKGKLKRPVDP